MGRFHEIREEFKKKAQKLIDSGDKMDFWISVICEMSYEIADLREKIKQYERMSKNFEG